MSEGKKFDQGKCRVDLVPPEFIEAVGWILKFGADKYGDNNWREGISYGRVYGALQRHLLAFWRGEDLDPESGHPHLWHAACNLAFLITFDSYPILYQRLDDRITLQEDAADVEAMRDVLEGHKPVFMEDNVAIGTAPSTMEKVLGIGHEAGFMPDNVANGEVKENDKIRCIKDLTIYTPAQAAKFLSPGMKVLVTSAITKDPRYNKNYHLSLINTVSTVSSVTSKSIYLGDAHALFYANMFKIVQENNDEN